MLRQDVDTKTLNARTEKWRQMMKLGLFSDTSLLSKRVRKGIPCGMRMIVWPRLLDLDGFMSQSHQVYDLLTKERSIIQSEIRLDIPRTFTQEKAQLMRLSLFNVLKALSLVYPELGYCQGMNHLSMKILETVTDETAFWVMNYLIRNYRNIYWNYKNPTSTSVQSYVLDKLMVWHLPRLRERLLEQGIPLQTFTPKWFITLFSSTLPIELFCRVFDCFFLQGYKIIYQTALALLKINQSLILHNELEQNLLLLLDKRQYQQLNHNKFINVVYLFEVSQEQISKLESQYLSTHQDEVISWQEQSQKLYQARILQKKTMEQQQTKQQHALNKPETGLILFDDDPEQ